LIGALYDVSLSATVAACVVLECAAIPFFVAAARTVRLPLKFPAN